jgi:hypothetical protein
MVPSTRGTDSDSSRTVPHGRRRKIARYRYVIEQKSDDHRTLPSSVLGDDGAWHQFMTATYRRKK